MSEHTAIEKYEQFRQIQTKKTSVDFLDEVKGSLAFKLNWAEALSAAPITLSILGCCYLAAASKPAAGVIIHPPAGGFKKLKGFTSLRANLMECGDMGTDAFLLAQKNMDKISLASRRLFGKVNDVMTLLGDLESAQVSLEPTMQAVKTGADECAAAAHEIDLKFGDWLEATSELHQSTLQESSTVSERARANEVDLLAGQAVLAGTQEAKDQAKAAFDMLGKSLKTCDDAFNDASHAIPGGWDLVGMTIVNGLANTVLGAINSAVQQRAAPGDQAGGQASRTNSGNPNAPISTTPADVNDPGYKVASTIDTYLHILQSIVKKGPDGGVDWDNVESVGTSGLGFALNMLQQSKKGFEPTAESASATAGRVLDRAISIAQAIDDQGKQNKTMGHEKLDANSPKVIEWQNTVKTVVEDNARLQATARTFPGAGASSPPSLAGQGSAVDNASGSLAATIMNSAGQRLQTAQAALSSAQEKFQASADAMVKVTMRVASLQGDLKKLDAEKITLAEIQEILIKAIESLVMMKAQILKLLSFFQSISTLVDFVANQHVKDFLSGVKAGLRSNETLKLAGISFTDFQKQTLFTSTLIVRAYFSLFREVSSTYTDISGKFIIPGISIVGKMAIPIGHSDKDTAEVAAQRRQELEKFAADATQEIATLAKKRQNDILDGMQQRIKTVTAETNLLPPSAVRGVIADSAKASTDESKAVIATIAETNPLLNSLSLV